MILKICKDESELADKNKMMIKLFARSKLKGDYNKNRLGSFELKHKKFSLYKLEILDTKVKTFSTRGYIKIIAEYYFI